MNSIDKTTSFTPTKEQQEKIDRLLNKHISVRMIGIDDVLELIAIAGAGYAAGTSAVAGIPAALGFYDYFYGI